MKRFPLFTKLATIVFLALLLLVPLTLIRSLVYERQARGAQVTQEIAASYAGAQTLAGPLLVLPYVEHYTTETRERDGDGKWVITRQAHKRPGAVHLMPAQLDVAGHIAVERKHRGIFEVPVYELEATLSGRFDLPANPAINRNADNSTIAWGEPYLSLAVSDPRGFAAVPVLSVDGKPTLVERGSELGDMPGVHAALPAADARTPGRRNFHVTLRLRGTERLGLLPLAGDTHVKIDSAWPHPSFTGRFLPDPSTQQAGADGFHAEWSISALASDAARQFIARAADCKRSGCTDAVEDRLDIRLAQPVSIYSLSDRALKYAVLFVVVVFAAFFAWEVLQGLAIHPIQYLLAGLALAMFFLLLLSLSEHLAFATAYGAAAAASTSLLAYYLSHVMRSWRGGLSFGACLALMFAALYGLLASEDNALVLGAVLAFALLAAFMVLTRRVDWYALARPQVRSGGTA
ncbi:MAG: cell envelope integrity protein CreD [Rhodocyclaceae bacterium]|nr:cell envelope integrity protein CreD [Rhodocyclaceae bacterium]MBX3668753.1 cell envelope integrity protein CreD [Rhodocyclaceae bacterium]